MQRMLVALCVSITLGGCGGGSGGGADGDDSPSGPKAQNQCDAVGHGSTVTLALEATDPDTPPGQLSYELPAQSEGGDLVLQDQSWNGNGRYTATYMALADAQWGRHSLTYRVRDESGAADSAEIHVVVRPRIMPLGDSITTGKYDAYDDSGTFGAEPETAGYRKRLWEALNDSGYHVDFVGSQHNGLPGMDIDHEGHNGIGSREVWEGEQLHAWLDQNPPDFVLLHIGTNDLNMGRAPHEVDLDVGEILARIENWAGARHPVQTLLAQIIDFRSGEEAVAQLNALTSGRVDAQDLVDQYGALRRDGAPVPALYQDELREDELHPSQQGYDAMADAWFEALEARLGSARCPTSL